MTSALSSIPPLPAVGDSVVVAEAPCRDTGCWAGAPSAVLTDDGIFFLAYRLRRAVGSGRGYANVIARSEDGEHFETILTIDRESFEAESLERPALVKTPGGRWRLYVSCATPGSKHWRVDLLEADDPRHFDPLRRKTVLPGNADWGVKDPVVAWHDDRWHAWLCCHPLESAKDADRMITRYGTSPNGVDWTLHGVALAGRAGEWDSRGTRIASVLLGPSLSIAYYDGRATAGENAVERTGIATGDTPGRFTAIDDGPVAVSPYGSGSLRYVSALPLPDGGYRLFYEATRGDGAHDLRSEYVPPSL